MFGNIFGKGVTNKKEATNKIGESLDISIEYLTKSLSQEERCSLAVKIIMMLLFGHNRLETESIESFDISKGYIIERDGYIRENNLLNAAICCICLYYFMSIPMYGYEDGEKNEKFIKEILDFLQASVYSEYFTEENHVLFNKLLDEQEYFVKNNGSI